MGFTEKEKIAFADSKTVPVIKDGDKPVKDSWAIAVYLDDMYPETAAAQERDGPRLRALHQRLGGRRGQWRDLPA